MTRQGGAWGNQFEIALWKLVPPAGRPPYQPGPGVCPPPALASLQVGKAPAGAASGGSDLACVCEGGVLVCSPESGCPRSGAMPLSYSVVSKLLQVCMGPLRWVFS